VETCGLFWIYRLMLTVNYYCSLSFMVCLQLIFTKPIVIKYKMHELTQLHDQFVHFKTLLGIHGTDNK
jgi:hypothetical protein